MVQLATHQDSEHAGGVWSGWWQCGTCKQDFNGAMLHGLAAAWWSRVGSNDVNDPTRVWAMDNLARSYVVQGKHDEAARMQEEVLAARKRLLGTDHPDVFFAAGNLAASYNGMGRHAKAAEVLKEVVAGMKGLWGPEDPNVLIGVGKLADAYA